MTFRFRVDPLLTLRRRQLDEAMMRLASANEAVLHAENLAARAGQSLSHASDGYGRALAQGVDNAELERHRTWIEIQRSQLAAADSRCAERRSAVRDAADHAAMAKRKVRMLEKLRERAVHRYETAVRAHEAREADVLAALKHARRTIEEGRQ